MMVKTRTGGMHHEKAFDFILRTGILPGACRPAIPQTRLITPPLQLLRAQQLPMSPLLTRLNGRVPWRRAGYLRILPSHQTQLKMRRQPLPSRRIPCRRLNRKAKKPPSLRLPLRPSRKPSRRTAFGTREISCRGRGHPSGCR